MENPNENLQALRLTGSRANGAEADGARLYHAVPRKSQRALCGAKPGRRSDWSFMPGERVTCTRCVARIENNAIEAYTGPDEHRIY